MLNLRGREKRGEKDGGKGEFPSISQKCIERDKENENISCRHSVVENQKKTGEAKGEKVHGWTE